MSRVLACDDDLAIGSLILALLRRDGLETDWVSGGRDAIEKLRETSYGAVLLDLMMPRGSGFDVLEWMRAEAPHLLPRVIVITAAAHLLRDELRQDVRKVFLKPFEIGELLSEVRASVEEATNT